MDKFDLIINVGIGLVAVTVVYGIFWFMSNIIVLSTTIEVY
jgi:hypothetical protein